MRRSRVIAAVSVIASLSLAVTACGGSSNKDEQQAKSGPTSISVGWNQPFYSYNDNSTTGNNTTNANIRYITSSQFYYYNADTELKTDPSFGTYEKTSDDPLTVKYTVSKDAKWSDGTPYDASDLLLSWAANSGNVNTVAGDKVKRDKATGAAKPSGNQVYFDSASATPGQSLSLVKETPKLSDDNRTLTLVYTQQYADWPLDMGPVGADLPAHVIAAKALGISDPTKAKEAVIKAITDKDDAALSKIANFWNTGFDYTSLPSDKSLYLSYGPYVISDIKKDSFVTFKKNPEYKGDRESNFDTLTVRFNPDANSQLQQLGNKEIALMDPQVTTDLVAAGEKLSNVDIHKGFESTFEHMDLVQNNNGPFDPASYGGDKQKALLVRQAFLHALPRQEIVDKLIKPIVPDATVRNAFLRVPGTEGYDEMEQSNGSSEYAKTDPAKAKSLLQQAGVKTPVNVRLMYDKTNARRAAEFQLDRPALAKAGFNVIDSGNADWSSKLGDGSYDAVFFGWQATSLAVTQDAAIYSSGGGSNLVGYANKTVDGEFTKLAASTDSGEQLSILNNAEKELWKDAIGIPIFQFPAAVMWDKSKITNVDPAILSPTMFYGFWDWKPASK
ncbi:MAG: ABC transporter family substrate-binding protein [Jiangellaceae bacterium]